MVATTASYDSPLYQALPGLGYDGIVRVSIGGYYGTGILLDDGRTLLTAAHLASGWAKGGSILFETLDGQKTVGISRVAIHPLFDSRNINNDLALIWLSAPAPILAERYPLYRDADEIGQTFSLVGYGIPGTGNDGYVDGVSSSVRRVAENRFDAEALELKQIFGDGLAWTPQADTLLVADFDSGLIQNDALGRFMGRYDSGLGILEGMITPGDSGGPALINGAIAGLASYGAALDLGSIKPDVDLILNASFGELGFWTRVSPYQQWIDQSLRQSYADAPARPEDVRKTLPEGNDGTSLAYFLVEFHGLRSNPDFWLSVDYRTLDGSAKAGEDYLAVNGTLILYPGEYHAVIPVEIIGDDRPEPDEIFYLEIYNPVGGSFPDGAVSLIAARTIVDDDWG